MISTLILAAAIGGMREEVLPTLPPVESELLERIFQDSWTFWYDETNMPRAMQFGMNSSPTHVHDGYHRFNNIDRTTNANIEFPWKDGGGLHLTKGVITAKFYWHPEHKPVAFWTSTRSSVFRTQQAYDWVFPIDSVVGEIIAFQKGGKSYPFEIRILVREEDAWDPRVWRQFNSTKQLADRIWELGYEKEAYQVGNLGVTKGTFTDTTHPRPAVSLDYSLSWVPALPEELVQKLLSEPLREVLEASTITTKVTQLLPANYLGGVVGHGRETCMQCHNHVAKHVDNFDRVGRDWYGYVRGSDRIFSFHPFSMQSISTNGGDLPVSFNQNLINSGYLTPYRGQKGYTWLKN